MLDPVKNTIRTLAYHVQNAERTNTVWATTCNCRRNWCLNTMYLWNYTLSNKTMERLHLCYSVSDTCANSILISIHYFIWPVSKLFLSWHKLTWNHWNLFVMGSLHWDSCLSEHWSCTTMTTQWVFVMLKLAKLFWDNLKECKKKKLNGFLSVCRLYKVSQANIWAFFIWVDKRQTVNVLVYVILIRWPEYKAQ